MVSHTDSVSHLLFSHDLDMCDNMEALLTWGFGTVRRLVGFLAFGLIGVGRIGVGAFKCPVNTIIHVAKRFILCQLDMCWIGDFLNWICLMKHFTFWTWIISRFKIEHGFVRISKFEIGKVWQISTVAKASDF